MAGQGRQIDFEQVSENFSDEELASLFLSSDGGIDVIKSVRKTDEIEKDSKYPTDPVEFARDILGVELWSRQQQIAQSIVDNKNTVVPASKGVGKSVLAAILVCWWMSIWDDGVVITLAPSAKHVNSVIWRYIRQFGRSANLPGIILDTPQWKFQDDSQKTALGLSTYKRTKEEITSLQGYHSPHLLVIMDEAAPMGQLVFDTVRGLVTSDENRTLAIGNPIAKSGPFYNATMSPNWEFIHISALETPNAIEKKDVIPGVTSYNWIKEAVVDHCKPCKPGEESEEHAFEFEGVWYIPDLYFITEILGLFPDESEKQLISRAWIKTAYMLEVNTDDKETVVSVDVARTGDESSIIVRTGYKVTYIERKKIINKKDPTGEIVDWAIEIYSRFDATTIFVDALGIGAGVADGLRRKGLPTFDVIFSSSPMNGTLFANLRAEVYWNLRTLLQKEVLELPEDDILESELSEMFVEYDRLGRLKLESKDDIRARTGKSPDTADALAGSFALGIEIDADAIDRANLRQLSKNSGIYPNQPNPTQWYSHTKLTGSRWRNHSTSVRKLIRRG